MSSELTPSSELITPFVYINLWVEDSASHVNITLNLTVFVKMFTYNSLLNLTK